MSATATKKKLAKDTILAVDASLSQWQDAFGRGEVDPKETGSVVDALLDLRTACTLVAASKKGEE